MTADVNVTEMEAGAEAQRRYRKGVAAGPLDEQRAFVAGALWHRARGGDFEQAHSMNVTEKAADRIARARGYVQGACVEEHYRDAREALSALSDPEVLAGMAGVLADHVLDEYANTCSCEKWEHFEDDYDERVATYTAHVATALADWLRGQG